MSSFSVLPVGVVVPTLNAMPHLARHVARLRELAPRVEEMVVVDSHSTDGTTEHLRQQLNLPNTRHLAHPPGLYASWNFGIHQIRARYVYVATVGDAVAPAALEELVAAAERHRADLVISPPKLVTETGQDAGRGWPIHEFIEQHGLTEAGAVPGWKAFAWTALSVPAGLMGSSASNLYRSAVMQHHPFSTGYGHHGDTAWMLENILQHRLVIEPRIRSEFLMHESAGRSRDRSATPRRALLSQLARETWRQATGSGPALGVPPGCTAALEDFWTEMDRWLAARQRHRQLSASHLWWMNPGAWTARVEQQRLAASVKAIGRAARAQLVATTEAGRAVSQ